MTRALLTGLIVLLAWLEPNRATAHSRPLSYSFWQLSAHGADVRVQVAVADLASLTSDADAAAGVTDPQARALQRLLELRSGDTVCEPRSAPVRLPSPGPWASWHWSVRCPESAGGPRTVAARTELLQSGHRHLARVDAGHGPPVERVLELAHPQWQIDHSRTPAGSSLLDYLALGVEHLLTGWDHMLFVLALLLLAERARDVLVLVTSFTLAHSLTLALATLSLLVPRTAPVEALIGFSIALLGAENCWLLSGRGRAIPVALAVGLGALAITGKATVSGAALCGLAAFSVCHFALLDGAVQPARLRVAIAFAFGLIHGFGFAGAMAELDLPVARLVPALLGFNLGVELGQVGVVVVAWPLLRGLARVRQGRWERLFCEVASAAVCGAGVFWFVVRSLS